MRANQRGWMFVAVHGSTSSNRRSNAAPASPGPSGGGPLNAARSAAGSPTATGGSGNDDPVLDDRVDHPVAEPAHLLGRQLQSSPPDRDVARVHTSMTLRHRAAPRRLAHARRRSCTPARPHSPRATRPCLAPQTMLDGALAAPAGTYATACHRAYRPSRAGVATRSVNVSGPGRSRSAHGRRGRLGRRGVRRHRPRACRRRVARRAGGRHRLHGRRPARRPGLPPLRRRRLRAGLARVRRRSAPARSRRRRPTRRSSSASSRPRRRRKDELLALGLDMTEHGGKESLGVVLHGNEDEEALRKAGFRWRVLVPDLAQQSREQRAADGALRRPRRPLRPSRAAATPTARSPTTTRS